MVYACSRHLLALSAEAQARTRLPRRPVASLLEILGKGSHYPTPLQGNVFEPGCTLERQIPWLQNML
jgi:hypothetical protein